MPRIETHLNFQSTDGLETIVSVDDGEVVNIILKDEGTDCGSLSLSIADLETIMSHINQHKAAVEAFDANAK